MSYLERGTRGREKKATLWSIVLVPVTIAAIMTPAILLAASGNVTREQGFNAIVRTMEMRYHARATKIPFMGLVSGIAGIATKGGVHGLHVAEFEHFRADGAGDFDGVEFNKLVEEHVGPGWQRMIRETSRDHGSDHGQTLIYVHPDGKNVAMLVVDLDGNELDIVQLTMNPERLMDQVNEHRHHHDADAPASGDDHNSVKPETSENASE